MARRKKRLQDILDYHEGLSENQVKIVLCELELNSDEFFKWMGGQTRPIVPRNNKKEIGIVSVGGVYEYDLFRWIEFKRKGTPLIWD